MTSNNRSERLVQLRRSANSTLHQASEQLLCLLFIEHTLASLTIAWSFDLEVSPKAVSSRHDDDLLAVLEVFHQEVVPHLGGANPGQMAEELFAGLMKGQMPP